MVNASVEVSKKVSYNPFKMWGAWVGAISSYGFFIYDGIAQNTNSQGIIFLLLRFFSSIPRAIYNSLPHGFTTVLTMLIVGFLVGWIVHSLFRYLKVSGKIFARGGNVSYNPFKMWGAWLGAGLSAPWVLLLTLSMGFANPAKINASLTVTIITLIVFTPLSLFLIGWGIHSLVRYLKNRR
ncbi:MAG: hypothetical protein KJ879_02660 [Nanoarchaeota archaeon]|nr:hypothetical protein [Nanoarchaeota archaeon]